MPVQRVRRVVRKIDPWTVLKVSFVFNAIMALVIVLGTVVFWSVFVNAGIPEKINDLAIVIGIENGITFDGPVYFRIVVLLAVIGTIMMTGFFTLAAVIYNLISDLVGGIEIVMLEEAAVARTARPQVTLPTSSRKKKAPKKKKTTPDAKVSPLPDVKPMTPPPTEAPPQEAPPQQEAEPDEVRKTGT